MHPSSLQPTTTTLSESFRTAFRCHPAGVAVITADSAIKPVAITVSSLISVSAEPPVVAFSLSAKSTASQAMLEVETLVIHLLQFSHLNLATLGATPGADRFGPGIAWERLPSGEPRYSGVDTWFRARILRTVPVEGATIVVAELIEGQATEIPPGEDSSPLVYFNRRWHRLQEACDPLSATSAERTDKKEG